MEIGNCLPAGKAGKLEILKKNWQLTSLIFLSIIFLFIYSWFPYTTTQDNGELIINSKNSKTGIFSNLNYPMPQNIANFSKKFASPDATANYFWINWYNYYGKLFYYEPYNIIANDYVVPRSIRSDDGVVRPVSFLGIIIIFSALAKIFGSWVIVYLTPIFSVLGVILFYEIIKRIFDKKIAFISALLLFALAPYWYYSARGLFHNVLFIDLLLMAGWCVTVVIASGAQRSEAQRGNLVSKRTSPLPMNVANPGGIATAFVSLTRNYSLAMTVLAGIFFGLAIITRTSELVWLVPAFLIAGIYYHKQLHWDKLIIFVCGLAIALMPMFYYNQILYGSYLNFGYTPPDVDAPSLKLAQVPEELFGTYADENLQNEKISNSPPAGKSSLQFALPFGFDLKNIIKSFWYYYVAMFWHIFIPACFGSLWFLWKYKEKVKTQQAYLITFLVVSFLLVIFYGSWEIQDNINLGRATIGNSYTRYWLPMYILSLPFASLFLINIFKKINNEKVRKQILFLTVAAIMLLNARAAVWGDDDGLVYVAEGIAKNKVEVAGILAIVEPESVIATLYADKYFWPQRRVINGGFSNDELLYAYNNLLAKNIPVYYYGFIFGETDWDYLQNRRLQEFNLQLEVVRLNIDLGLGLYRIKKAHE
ncbi:MAG: glycosyltransferase family 39 protein [bacterium]|nr:glycosyltransferase family 39 protein [bacterium]